MLKAALLVIYRLVCMKDKMRNYTLHLYVDSLGWSTLKLLAGAKKNNTIVRILDLTIQSCISEDILKEVAMENTGQMNEDSLVFLWMEWSEFKDKAFRV